jgi:HNH endonuclease
MLTQHQLRQLFDYNPETGLLIRLMRTNVRGPSRIGDVAGNYDHGYIRLSILNKHYYAHILIWAWMTGEWPVSIVEHWDGNGTNNKWGNLRLANDELNIANKVRIKHGVELHGRKFRARIIIDRVRYELGSFDNKEEAKAVYKEALIQSYGEYAVYNRP